MQLERLNQCHPPKKEIYYKKYIVYYKNIQYTIVPGCSIQEQIDKLKIDLNSEHVLKLTDRKQNEPFSEYSNRTLVNIMCNVRLDQQLSHLSLLEVIPNLTDRLPVNK